jgi:hypothetical protein
MFVWNRNNKDKRCEKNGKSNYTGHGDGIPRKEIFLTTKLAV